jgi:hypothetical protein
MQKAVVRTLDVCLLKRKIRKPWYLLNRAVQLSYEIVMHAKS